MPPDRTPSTRRRRSLAIILGALCAVAVIAGGASLRLWIPGAPEPMPAPGLSAPVDAAGLRDEGYGVTMAVLGDVYAAFAQTGEAAIYDRLAEVAAGDALEALYLERAGALATGGLPDQLVHELRLTEGTWTIADGAMTVDARWTVLGQVGHAEHTHLRGNAYGAELTLAPAGGAWRLTDFRLTDVDRTGAGTYAMPDGAGAEALGPAGAAAPPG